MSGFLAVEGRRDEDVLARLTDAFSYRGAPRTWRDDRVVLVAFERRGIGLAVTDDLVVALDGRLDERATLDAQLGPSVTDAERIARAWRRWGIAGLERCIGDFAGAIYERGSRRLVVVRDAVGARPAFVARSDGRLLAGSGVAALFADRSVDRTRDELWLATFLEGARAPDEATPYQAIRRVGPGALAEARDGEWVMRSWFSWRIEAVRERTHAAYADRLRSALDEAVRCRLPEGGRLGIALSGGLDSTSIAATARALDVDADITALAIPFTDPRGDERALQQLVAQRLGLRLRWVPLDGASPFAGEGEPWHEIIGGPPVSPNLFQLSAVADLAAREGLMTVLDGVDGDAILGGHLSFLSDLMARGRVARWWRELSAVASRGGRSRRALLRTSLRGLLPRRRSKVTVLEPAFVHRAGFRLTREPWRPGREMHERALRNVVARAHSLEELDEVFARRGLEVSHPFLDRRVVELALGMPWHEIVSDGVTKRVLRRAMAERLPEEILARRGKANLSGPLIEALTAAVSSGSEGGIRLRTSKMAGVVRREVLDQASVSPVGRDGATLYRLVSAGLWLAGARAEPVALGNERRTKDA